MRLTPDSRVVPYNLYHIHALMGEVFQTSFKPITTQFVRLYILEAEMEPQIRDMQLFADE